jgi:DNA-binding NarL/FixJ family response regulator
VEAEAMADRAGRTAHRAGRVLIVDDHPVVREGLGIWIGRQPDLEVCGEASSVAEALALVDATDPDVAVIDISLGDGDGLDLIRRICGRGARVRILVWSTHPESLYAERALHAGALGYINKREATGQIIEAIRLVLAGQVCVSRSLADRLLRRRISGRASGEISSAEFLTDRELEVFRLIGGGLTTAEVASRMNRSVSTIETYRQRIKKKLGLRNAVELIRAATQWMLENK